MLEPRVEQYVWSPMGPRDRVLSPVSLTYPGARQRWKHGLGKVPHMPKVVEVEGV